MVTFIVVWLCLSSISLVFNYFINSINPRDDDENQSS
jgi:hypothetical protein